MVNGINLILVAIFGLVIGSFLNVLIFRIDNLKSVLTGRSKCMHCKHVLSSADLIPLFSFLILRGKCRYCHKKLSIQYPIIELLTALVFVFLFFYFGANISAFIFYAVVFSSLIVVSVHDLKTQYVPQEFVIFAVVLLLAFGSQIAPFDYKSMLLGGLVGGGIPAVLVLVSRERWMGSGDIGVGLVLGMLVGFPVSVFGFFLACLLGSVVGLVYVYINKKTIKLAMPFAPFLVLSALFSLVWGERIISWYFNSFIN